jgi:hypothetical protein
VRKAWFSRAFGQLGGKHGHFLLLLRRLILSGGRAQRRAAQRQVRWGEQAAAPAASRPARRCRWSLTQARLVLFAPEPSCGWPGADRGGAGSFDEASLAAYLALGVTRVNLGVQSFDAAMLKGVPAESVLS